MKLITHWKSRRWLSAYLDSELTGETLRRVSRHVAVCRTCQRDLERIRSGRDLVVRREVIREQLPVGVTPRAFPFQHLRVARWGLIAVLAVMIVVASGGLDSRNWLFRWWPPSSAQAMDASFYREQVHRTNYCVSPCSSLAETSINDLRSSPPFPLQYPARLPEGMILRRVIRYRTLKHEGIGLVFAGNGKEFSLFQQPRSLGVATPGRRTTQTKFCGRMCTWIDGDQLQLFVWRTESSCFVVATNLEKSDAESVVEFLQPLGQ